MNRIKVLIAEDEKDVRQIMSKKIAEQGYAVVTAADGEEAWAKIQSDDPDVVILDLVMPRRDGLSILKELRENPPHNKWRPVIIVSALGELEDMKKGFDLEADHYLTKPCNVNDVLKGIHLMVSLIPQRKSKFEQ